MNDVNEKHQNKPKDLVQATGKKEVLIADLSSLKVSKEWDICWRFREGLKCPLFLVACSPGKSFRFTGNAPSSPPFFFKRCLLRASMLLWSAWANTSAYTSYINGWKSWRNEKIGRTRTHWTLAEPQCHEGTNSEFMSTSESLKGRVSYQNSAKAWEMLVSAWEREIASKCVRLTLNAWDFRALSLRSLLAAVFCAVLSKKVARDRQRHLTTARAV